MSSDILLCHTVAVPGKTEYLFQVKVVLCIQVFWIIYDEKLIQWYKSICVHHYYIALE